VCVCFEFVGLPFNAFAVCKSVATRRHIHARGRTYAHARTQKGKKGQKRKYNSEESSEVSQEEMEAYRMKKARTDDPMAAMLGSDKLLDL